VGCQVELAFPLNPCDPLITRGQGVIRMADNAQKGRKAHPWEPEDKYSDVLEVPLELHAVRDAAIEFALNGGDPPEELHLLEEWFANDFEVYENTHSDTAAMQFDPAVRVASGRLYEACDSELRDRLGLSEDALVTDAMRISYTRNLLEEEWTFGGETIVAVATRTIVDADGRSCLIGYIEESHGQAGVVCVWEGVFAGPEAWESHLQSIGLHRCGGPEEVPDDLILKIYNLNND